MTDVIQTLSPGETGAAIIVQPGETTVIYGVEKDSAVLPWTLWVSPASDPAGTYIMEKVDRHVMNGSSFFTDGDNLRVHCENEPSSSSDPTKQMKILIRTV